MRLFIAAVSFAVTLGSIALVQTLSRPAPATLQNAQLAQPWFGQAPPQTTKLASPTNTPTPEVSTTFIPEPTGNATTPLSATLTPTPIPLIVTLGTPTATPGPVTTAKPTASPVTVPAPTATPLPTPIPIPSATATPAPSPTASPEPAPSVTASPSTYTIAVVSLTSPITRGSDAKLMIATNVGAECTLKVTLPSGSVSSAAGLAGSRTADGYGQATWQWKIGGSTKAGTAKLDISCNQAGQDYTAALQMEITE